MNRYERKRSKRLQIFIEYILIIKRVTTSTQKVTRATALSLWSAHQSKYKNTNKS
jgi:hypothetical protein